MLFVLILIGCSQSTSESQETIVSQKPVPTKILIAPTLSVEDIVERVTSSIVEIVRLDGSGKGTGFIVSPDGIVVTNEHVIGGDTKTQVRVGTGSEIFKADVIDKDSTLDIAFIRIDSNKQFDALPMGEIGKVRVGEQIIAIGFPYFGAGSSINSPPSVTIGIVSAIRDTMIQTDAALNPGNSGGPLLNMQGEVIGVAVSKVEYTPDARPITGVGFALPINLGRVHTKRKCVEDECK